MSLQDDQTLTDPVEETTAPDSSPEEIVEEQPTEEPTETPSEEVTEPDETDSSTDGSESAEEAPEEDQSDEPAPQKERGAQKRIRNLVERNKRLQAQLEQSYGGQSPQQPPTQQQAAQMVNDLHNQYDATGQLPEEITREDYERLVAVANGQAMAQTDAKSAELEREVYQMKLEREREKRVAEVTESVSEAQEKYDVFNPSSTAYDKDYDDMTEEALLEALEANPKLNVDKFLERQAKIYNLAREKGGASVTATVAKQAQSSALPPTGASPKREVDTSKMSRKELQEYLENTVGSV